MAVALFSATAVAACSEAPSRQFNAVLQVTEETQPLPVVLSDETGLVTGMASGPMDPRADYSELVALADPTDPNAFIVRWLGGACDHDGSLTFKRHEEGYVLNVTVHDNRGFLGGCVMLGIYRDVRIVTSSPIPVDSILTGGV
jgi:hypothetical protein